MQQHTSDSRLEYAWQEQTFIRLKMGAERPPQENHLRSCISILLLELRPIKLESLKQKCYFQTNHFTSLGDYGIGRCTANASAGAKLTNCCSVFFMEAVNTARFVWFSNSLHCCTLGVRSERWAELADWNNSE